MGFRYKIMNYEEKSYDDIEHNGLSVDYMARETKRAIADTKHSIQIYPSVNINVPLQRGEKQSTPEGVKAEVSAAFTAGADGIVLSREYTEMWLGNLAAAGEASRQMFARSNA